MKIFGYIPWIFHSRPPHDLQVEPHKLPGFRFADRFRLYRFQTQHIIRAELAPRLEHEFRRFLSEQQAEQLFRALPTGIHYYPLIEQCYNRIFYDRGQVPDSCPGPARCALPPVKGLQCAVARRDFQHLELHDMLALHLPVDEGRFELSLDGCAM